MTSFLKEYAGVYDLIYGEEKDYPAEVDFLEALFRAFSRIPVRRILDLACGTGGHAVELASKGYQVTGLDLSEAMIQIAQKKTARKNLKIDYHIDQMQQFALHRQFDAVICMFSAFDYLTADSDIANTLNSIRRHLIPFGLLIFDFWNESIFRDRIEKFRVKDIRKDSTRLIRISESSHDKDNKMLDVKIKCLHIENNFITCEFTENHHVRYFGVDEINKYLRDNGFRRVHICPFLDLNGNPKKSLSLTVIAQSMES